MKKSIYTLWLSDDGIHCAAYTNIKALFNALTDMEGYMPSTIEGIKPQDANLKFSYSNLIKVIRAHQENNRLSVATIHSENGGSIEINDLTLVSK